MAGIEILEIILIVAFFLIYAILLFSIIRAGMRGTFNWFVVIFATIIGLLLITFLIANINNIVTADWAQILILLGLVAVTGIYAWSTQRQADASVKMAEEMREQRYAEALPLLVPTITPIGPTEWLAPNEIDYLVLQVGAKVKVTWLNLGKGTAVNSRFSLYAIPLNDETPEKILSFLPYEKQAWGSGESKEIEMQGERFHDKPTAYRPRLEAEYQDIYERKITTVQEFRITEENGNKKAFLGELYFTVNGKRLGEEIAKK